MQGAKIARIDPQRRLQRSQAFFDLAQFELRFGELDLRRRKERMGFHRRAKDLERPFVRAERAFDLARLHQQVAIRRPSFQSSRQRRPRIFRSAGVQTLLRQFALRPNGKTRAGGPFEASQRQVPVAAIAGDKTFADVGLDKFRLSRQNLVVELFGFVQSPGPNIFMRQGAFDRLIAGLKRRGLAPDPDHDIEWSARLAAVGQFHKWRRKTGMARHILDRASFRLAVAAKDP